MPAIETNSSEIQSHPTGESPETTKLPKSQSTTPSHNSSDNLADIESMLIFKLKLTVELLSHVYVLWRKVSSARTRVDVFKEHLRKAQGESQSNFGEGEPGEDTKSEQVVYLQEELSKSMDQCAEMEGLLEEEKSRCRSLVRGNQKMKLVYESLSPEILFSI